jgi:hypothetical protein
MLLSLLTALSFYCHFSRVVLNGGTEKNQITSIVVMVEALQYTETCKNPSLLLGAYNTMAKWFLKYIDYLI